MYKLGWINFVIKALDHIAVSRYFMLLIPLCVILVRVWGARILLLWEAFHVCIDGEGVMHLPLYIFELNFWASAPCIHYDLSITEYVSPVIFQNRSG